MKKLKMMLILSVVLVSSLQAETIIGKVYGNETWIAYVPSNSKYIFIRKGQTDFAKVCDTKLVIKGNYVLTPSGRSLTTNKSVRTEIQRRLNAGKYYGCR